MALSSANTRFRIAAILTAGLVLGQAAAYAQPESAADNQTPSPAGIATSLPIAPRLPEPDASATNAATAQDQTIPAQTSSAPHPQTAPASPAETATQPASSPAAKTEAATQSVSSPAANTETATQPVSPQPAKTGSPATNTRILKGTVEQGSKPSPFLTGSIQYLPKGTTVDFTIQGVLNSEVSQKGQEVWMKVAHDVNSAGGVGVPGGWYAHGLVTESVGQKRGGRDGYITVQFDKLVSPDGQDEVPFDASVSTKDHMMKTVAKLVAIDSGYVAEGALGGSILSVQLTGIPLVVASHGYSVAIGAAVGATIGAYGAAKRKGNIKSLYTGDTLRMTTAEPISLPGFNKSMLPSASHIPTTLKNLDVAIKSARFGKDPGGDRLSSLLTLDLDVHNKTTREFKFSDFSVVSDFDQQYYPSIYGGLAPHKIRVVPNSQQEGIVTFTVAGAKHKYWLVLVDKVHAKELTRIPIN